MRSPGEMENPLSGVGKPGGQQPRPPKAGVCGARSLMWGETHRPGERQGGTREREMRRQVSTPIGICQLCMNKGTLCDSHVWPKFAYKRYVSDVKRGGSFTDLYKQKHHNKQVTDYLFCTGCEQRLSLSEKNARQFLERVERNPTCSHDYEALLHYFAVSISWRTALYNLRSGPEKNTPAMLKKPRRYWREFLVGKRAAVRPYSQHGFIAFGQTIEGKDAEWHKSLGGQVFLKERLVLSRIGPLLLVGILDRGHLSMKEIRTWELSRLRRNGGVIGPIAKNCPEEALTSKFARLLNTVEKEGVELAFRMKR